MERIMLWDIQRLDMTFSGTTTTLQTYLARRGEHTDRSSDTLIHEASFFLRHVGHSMICYEKETIHACHDL